MENSVAGEVTCSNCGNPISDDDDFCPHCGAIFSDGVFCDKHQRVEAVGVCVVCALPCCNDCGTDVNGLFLCNSHSDYEIYEGMVKVFGSHDVAEAELTKARLDDAGLHPVLFHLYRAKGTTRAEYEAYKDGEAFNASELKVMVPCQEVKDAEAILASAS